MIIPRLTRNLWFPAALVAGALAVSFYFPVSRTLAAPSATVLSGAGRPLVNLRNPLTLKQQYAGPAEAVSELRAGSAKPVSLLVADLDRDGAPDLIAGYQTSRGGVVTITRGNRDAYAPKDASLFKAAVAGRVPPSFLSAVVAYEVPESPDLMATGNFSGHGHEDVLLARNGGGLYLLEGDGRGGLSEARQVDLPGNVSALAANGDGRVAVGVAGGSTPQLLIFDPGKQGWSEPVSTHPLNDVSSSIVWGDLGSRTGSDVAALTGNEIFVVYRAGSTQEQVEHAGLPFHATAVAAGDFIWDRAHRNELAVIADDGTVHILPHGALDTRPLTGADADSRRVMRQASEMARGSRPQNALRLGGWQLARTLNYAAQSSAGVAAQSRIQSPRLAATSTHDLMVLDSGLRQVNLLDTSGAATSRSAVAFSSAPVAAATLPSKLNGEHDFVVLTAGHPAPVVLTSAVTQLATVTTTTDEDDAGACTNSSVTLGTTGADGQLSLREALCEANNSTGTIDVLLPPGTYKVGLRAGGETGELQFGTKPGANLFLIGTGTQNNTAIEQINGIDRVFNIDPALVGNVTATILNVTIKDGTETDGQGGSGILAGAAGDVVTLSDCTVSSNTTMSGDSGGGITFANGGTLIANSVSFTGNTATQASGGGLYFVEAAGGSLQVISSFFTSNTAGPGSGNGGGIFANLAGGSASITGSQFTGNAAAAPGALGGGIFVENGALTISSSRIVGNTAAGAGNGLYASNSASLSAMDNWWGCNAGPGSTGCDNQGSDGSSAVTSNPWLVLTLSAASPAILPNSPDVLTANVDSDSNGTGGFFIPNGTAFTFTSTLGTVNPSTAYSTVGQAKTTFTAGPAGGTGTATATLDNQSVTTNILIGLAPAITSANSAAFSTGTAGSFSVIATGTPEPAISESGALPSGVAFLDSGNGSATLSGTPSAGAGGSYTLTITAANGVSPSATQLFTLTVNGAAAFTSANAATFPVGSSASFSVTASGFPAPTLTESGALPSGVSFKDNGNGTGTLNGTPAAGSAGAYHLSFTAHNSSGSDATQAFTLTVSQAPAFTSSGSTTFQVGSAGTFTVAAAGFPSPSISESGALPTGVTLVDNKNGTATLSGTAAAGTGGSYPVVITAQNGAGANATQSFTLSVNQAPAVTSSGTAAFQVGSTGTFTVTTTGFPAPSLTQTGILPAGVTFVDHKNGTATLSGSPAASGTYNLTIQASNSVSTATQDLIVSVDLAPAFNGANGTTFTAGSLATFTVTASGFPAPSFTEAGALPGGVTFVDNKNGTATLKGSATGGGVFPLTLTASNSVSSVAQKFTLTVNQAPAITSANTASLQVGVNGSFTITTVGFPAASLAESGSLPAGVTFVDNKNGTATLSGAAASAGSFSLSLSASNSVSTTTQSFTLSINQMPAISSSASAVFNVGAVGSFTVTASGTPAPALSVKGTLPAGVSFADNKNGTGTLSGNPSASGVYSISFTASNAAGSSTQDFTLTVNRVPAITSVNSAAFQVGVAASFTVTTLGSPVPALSASGSLPVGTLFADNGNGTASLSGTPSQAGSFPLTLNATSSAGASAQSFTLTVAKANTVTTIASSANPSGTGQAVTLTATVALTVAGTPTGNVTFFDGATSLGSAALNAGTATLAVSSLAAGTHTLTASYGGDSNFAASTSTGLSQVINAGGNPDFAIAASPGSNSVAPGSTASYTISAGSFTNGFSGTISLSCSSGVPALANCTFAPGSMTTGAPTSTLSIKTTAPTVAMLTEPAVGRHSQGLLAVWLMVPGMMAGGIGLWSGKRRKRLGYLFALLAVAASMLMAGCGSSSSGSSSSTTSSGGTPAGTYTITVTGTSGSTTHTTSVTLTVQ
jgi:hypothetical protein